MDLKSSVDAVTSSLEKNLTPVLEDVYPLHALDDIKPNRMFVSWMMRFNDVLDAQLLDSALSRLLEIGDWKKLGGRLRFAEDKKLHIHVSRSPFRQQNVSFTHVTHDISIQDHPVASRFPQETDGPSVHPVLDDMRPFVARPDFPATVDELIRQNLPQISLHVTSFNDATLVGLVWPHTLMDAVGGKALLAAWSLVLAGREEDVPLVIGARTDTPSAISNEHKIQEEFHLERKRLTGASLLMFCLRYLWERFWNPPLERRVVFLPQMDFAKLRDQAHKDLAENTQELESRPFVSDADILTAWITRAVALSEPRPRPVTALNLLNARFRLTPLMKPSGVYIQNMLLGTFTFLSAPMATGPMGAIALHHRESFVRQSTESQALGFLRSILEDIKAGKNPRLLFGESNAMPIVFNNVIKLDLMKIANFGPAVLRKGDTSTTRTNPLGTMAAYHNGFLDGSWKGINMVVLLGKDHGGNYWVQGTLLPRAWASIENEVRILGEQVPGTKGDDECSNS